MIRFLLSLLCLATTPISGGTDGIVPEPIVPGPWRAWLDGPGGELPFELEISVSEGLVRATILNGEERFRVPRVVTRGDEIVFELTQYDAGFRGTLSENGKRLDGTWWRRLRGDRMPSLPFHAIAGHEPRFRPIHPKPKSPAKISIDGRWLVQFDEREQHSAAVFTTTDSGTIDGTFMNSSGDYRFLSGSFEGNRLRLSRFDGAHAFLFDARMLSDGSLEGRFWEGDYWEDSWIAWKDIEAEPPDSFGQFEWTGAVELGSVELRDLEGKSCTLADPRFAGKALVVEILGSWCPNCYDASRVLEKLHARHGDGDLSVVGLAFEMSDDFEQNVKQLRIYHDVAAVSYPILIASGSGASPSELFPTIKGLWAFPTLIFLRGDGQVHAVLTGFVGPAAGDEHARLVRRIDAVIDELLTGAGSRTTGQPVETSR